ncbi:MAG: hypothetical protein WB987_18585 [Candidatus Acidiferrales bacterium]
MSLFKSMRREVGHGGIVTPGWRLAWYEPPRRLGIYYPVPINWVIRTFREIRYRLGLAIHAPGIERAQVFEMQRAHRERERLAEEYSQGYMSGWRECFQACLEVVENEIGNAAEWHDVGAWLSSDTKPRQEN